MLSANWIDEQLKREKEIRAALPAWIIKAVAGNAGLELLKAADRDLEQ